MIEGLVLWYSLLSTALGYNLLAFIKKAADSGGPVKVAIFFGSKSDTATMGKAAAVLEEFGIEYKAFVISAHRAGELLHKTVKQCEDEGFEVIIAGAGLAAALPGVIAGITTIPVIGVPLECVSDKSNGLGGMDALLSIVQMPPQIPVATVGIGNAKNAGYLACQILSIKYPELKTKLLAFRKKLADDAAAGVEAGVTF